MSALEDVPGGGDHKLVVEGVADILDRRVKEIHLDIHDQGLGREPFVVVDPDHGLEAKAADQDLLASKQAGRVCHRSVQVLTAIHGDHLSGDA